MQLSPDVACLKTRLKTQLTYKNIFKDIILFYIDGNTKSVTWFQGGPGLAS